MLFDLMKRWINLNIGVTVNVKIKKNAIIFAEIFRWIYKNFIYIIKVKEFLVRPVTVKFVRYHETLTSITLMNKYHSSIALG